MHLKESNVPRRGGVLSLEPSEDINRNARSSSGSTSLSDKHIINNNNNNTLINNNNINSAVCDKDNQPVLIIGTAGAKSSPTDSQVVTSCQLGGRDGMSHPSPTSSLPDLSENGSCGSDRLHHPSISSGGPNHLRHIRSSSNCSLSSIDNDESDLESFSSLEVDIPRGDVQDSKLAKERDSRSLLDFEVLGYHSRRPSSSSCGFQEVEAWPGDGLTQLSLQCNDLSPDKNTSNNNNNINELTSSGAFVKSFYDKPKLQLSNDTYVNNRAGDDNGNVASPDGKSGAGEICNSCTSTPDSAGYISEDENPSDIEQKMAETKVKMNDAILSNGKEELALHSRKMKQYIKHKELKESCGAAATLKHTNNNAIKQPNSLKLPDTNDGDNRYTQVPESPIVDAYEKECLDVPEKMVRELENQAKESQGEGGGAADDFIPCKKEKMEINEHKKCRTDENDNDDSAPVTPTVQTPVKRLEGEGNKENATPPPVVSAPPAEKPSLARVTFSGVDEVVVRRHDSPHRRREKAAFRKSVPQASCGSSARAKLGSPDGGEFDVYTMETAMPKIDWDAIEAHLKATKEEERRRRNDREEIRRKLAMGVDDDQFMERPYRKPSLHSRLQSGMNLQICFMNETASDCESQCSDTESTQDREIETDRVSTSSANSKASTPQPTRTRTSNSESDIREKEVDFFARQAQLQAEARLALAQAKEMARMQMEIEKQQKKKSPIAEIVRESFHKIGVPFPDSKRRISRQILTDMNVAQLQVIANDLHTQIESLNEDLVTLLMERDDLHMEQDSMLVDIEDLTKHIGAKELSLQRSTDSKDETKTSWTTSPAPRNKSNSMRLKIKK
ncbi:schwannomin-interacting protein 1-like isoform X1 [Penaeus japonicus]|uniref:schwannomin-interacting protein 1-like isoform X1 n=1 Tax=Penaeus japonicus TaxID=27405 RepID=UPI001C715688|nr:schwannomin-interacting protein 1-like isoform X1 [Penaeus japonicus]XP_042860656.1 schwannomin-interacting protein 1-like isoform X1 [Penaeus japonicus]